MGRLVRRLRDRLGISQRELAKRAGIKGAYITMIESGYPPSLDTMTAIVRALGADHEEARTLVLAVLRARHPDACRIITSRERENN